MSKLPKILLYRGVTYQQVNAADTSASDDLKEQVEAAISALGGHRTGQEIGGPTKLRDGGEPWSTEVITTVHKFQPASEIAEAFPYGTLDWCGFVEVRIVDGSPVITAKGQLALDGLCFDELARVLGEDDVISGDWNGEKWSWRRDLRSR
jgi:hypothetical protein